MLVLGIGMQRCSFFSENMQYNGDHSVFIFKELF